MGSMRQNLCSSSRAQIPQPPSPPPTTHPTHHLSPISNPTIPTLTCKLSRRQLTATLPFLFTPGHHLSQAQANELDPQSTNTCTTTMPTTTKTAFLDIAIDGEPSGRITVALFTDTAPLGTARFASLLTGTAGISYRRKEFVKITPAYIQHVGVRSYAVDPDMARRTGGQLAAGGLVAEWEAAADTCPGATKSVAGSVGLVVRDPARPPPKMKLVARQGKLVVDEEEVGSPQPNGTEFVIAMKDSPELDAAALVVGRVVGGMEVVERIAKVKTVQENTSSPYFRVAKLIGDKRAVVAERGFNRPYSKVVVTNCGLID